MRVEQKQEYLRSSIIQKGFQAQQFSQFMKSQLGEKYSELEEWGYTKLRNLVRKFKTQKHKTSFRFQELREQMSYNARLQLKDFTQQEQLPCKQIMYIPTKMCLQVVSNKITTFKKFIFSENQCVFVINNNRLGRTIQRNYQDILWLRNIASKSLPFYWLPQLKAELNFSNDPVQSLKRNLHLQHFLQVININEQLSNQQLIIGFFNIPDGSDFQTFKNLFKQEKTHSPSSQLLDDGNYQCLFSNLVDKFVQNVTQQLQQQKIKYQAIGNAVQKVIEGLKQAKEGMLQMSTKIAEITQTKSKFYQEMKKNMKFFNNFTLNLKPLQQLVLVLNNWTQAVGSFSSSFKTYFNTCLQVEHGLNSSLNQYYQKRRQMLKDYAYANKTYNKLKDDSNKNKLEQAKNWFGLLTGKLISQTWMAFQLSQCSNQNHMKRLLQNQVKISEQLSRKGK